MVDGDMMVWWYGCVVDDGMVEQWMMAWWYGVVWLMMMVWQYGGW